MRSGRPTRLLSVFGTILVLSTTFVACDSDSDDGDNKGARGARAVLVGEVDGGKALIAVVRSDDGLTIYSCGIEGALTTHTGWFFGAPKGDEIPTLVSAGGLELSGRVSGDHASGTIKLKNGDKVSWTADRAQDGAGLYGSEDTTALTGLVVANNGKLAGNARLSGAVTTPGGSTPTTLGTVSTTSTSTTSTTRPPTTTTTPGAPSVAVSVPSGAPTTSGNTVQVTFPVGGTVVQVPLDPIVTPGQRAVLKTGPTVVFLAHGMADNFGAAAPDAPEDVVKCEGPPNRPFYSRCEWGIDFIPGLFGLNPNARMFNLAGRDMTGLRYLTDAVNSPTNNADARLLIDENIGITARDANGCVTNPAAQPTYDPRAANHFVTATQPIAGTPPPLSVFTTWRDARRGLVETGKRLTNQTYAALKWYEKEYNVTPRIVFVTQSFGGLGTRFLLSNPPPESYNTALLNADGVVVCPEERVKMDYLRDRTTHAVTLNTPHEGSYMSEWGEPGKQILRDALNGLSGTVTGANVALQRSVIARVIRAIDATVPLVVPRPPNLVQLAQGKIQELLRLLDGPALRDMKLATMTQFNLGPIAPDRARRTAGSPIVGAANTFIPIYVTLGRSPGSTSFNSPKIIEGWNTHSTETEKEKGWMVSTMLFSDVITKQLIPNGFGRADVAPYAQFQNLLDRRARLFDLSDQTVAAEQFVANSANTLVNRVGAYFAGKFGPGVGGINTYLANVKLQVFLANAMIPIHVDRKWELQLTGKVDVPMLTFSCGGGQIVIDYDPFVRALLTTAGNTDQLITALQGQNLQRAFDVARAAVADGPTLLQDTYTWFRQKYQALATVPEQCRLPLPTGQVLGDFLALLNLANWRVGSTTGQIPAPQWERTDTPVRDGELDNDGPVHSASALGFTLSRRPFFFEHNRDDGPVVNGQPTIGSWYRIFDNPVVEKYNHGPQYNNDVARWIQQRLLGPDVGPIAQRDRDSIWTQ